MHKPLHILYCCTEYFHCTGQRHHLLLLFLFGLHKKAHCSRVLQLELRPRKMRRRRRRRSKGEGKGLKESTLKDYQKENWQEVREGQKGRSNDWTLFFYLNWKQYLVQVGLLWVPFAPFISMPSSQQRQTNFSISVQIWVKSYSPIS